MSALGITFAMLPLLTAIVVLPINAAHNDAGFGRAVVTDTYGKRALVVAALISALSLVRPSFDGCSRPEIWLVAAATILTLLRLYFHMRIGLDFVGHHFPKHSTWFLTRGFLSSALLVLVSSWLALVPWMTWGWATAPALWLHTVWPDSPAAFCG